MGGPGLAPPFAQGPVPGRRSMHHYMVLSPPPSHAARARVGIDETLTIGLPVPFDLPRCRNQTASKLVREQNEERAMKIAQMEVDYHLLDAKFAQLEKELKSKSDELESIKRVMSASRHQSPAPAAAAEGAAVGGDGGAAAEGAVSLADVLLEGDVDETLSREIAKEIEDWRQRLEDMREELAKMHIEVSQWA